MARINIDIGTLGNPATGDTLRGAMEKINTNFTEVYQLVGDGDTGLLTTSVTNGNIKVQPNGSGIVEIDALQINGDAITSVTTNASVEITGNGTGGVNIEALSFNGTSVSSTDSSTINLNDNVTVDGDLAVSGTITGTISVSAVGDITAVGSTLSTPSNADFDITPGGTGNVNLNGDTVRVGDNDADATITTQGTGDLTLSTNGGTNSGTIIIRDGSNGDIILEPDGTGDVLLKGDKVGIGTVNQPDTLLHLKDTNAVITLQRTADANTPGISFQQSGGNVRGVIKLDGTSGTSNEIFMQTYDGASLAERFRVTHTGAKVSGTLNVDDGISITDNTITTSASNANLELTASGTGAVKVDAILSLPDGSDSDNYVGVGDADDLKIFHNGSHSIIRETGTGNLFLQSDNNVIIGKDSGSETMIKGVADGEVELYHDNVKKLNTSSSGVTVVDELHTEGATPHLTLKRTDNANVPTLRFKGSGGTVGASIDFQGTGGTSNELAFQVFDGASLAERFRVTYTGAKVTGTLDIDSGITITDNKISASQSNADLELNASGTGAVVIGDAIKIRDNHIEGTRSNEDIIIDPAGTGNVIIPTDKITLGTNAAAGTEGVAIGKGTAGVGTGGVAVGLNAGNSSQGSHTVAVGEQAGETSQGVYAVAVGMQAGETSQGATGVAIGYSAGKTNQGTDAVAIGQNAGLTGQGDLAIGIGEFAGSSNQGTNAIAIGEGAGKTNQAANSIVINASGSELNNTTASSFVVKPIRSGVATNVLGYNTTSGEITYNNGIQIFNNQIQTTESNADLELNAAGSGAVVLQTIKVIMANLPTSDPSVAGQLYNDSGTLKVSAG